MTLAEQIIKQGYKDNSMYESNTVRGSATAEDMERYLAKESSTKHLQKPIKPNAMKTIDFTKLCPNPFKIHDLIIEEVEED